MRRHPEQITGMVTMSHELILLISLFQLAPVALTLLLVSIVAPTPQTSGAIFGVFTLSAAHLLWLRHHRRSTKTVALSPSGALD